MRTIVNQPQVQRWTRYRSTKTAMLGILLIIMQGNVITDSDAAFTLNWLRDEGGGGGGGSFGVTANATCHMSYLSSSNCNDTDLNGAHDDGTAFLQEEVTLDGQDYWHVIVGDYTRDEMAQEVFIKASGSNQSFNGFRVSDSVANNGNQDYNMANPYSSTSSNTGSGSANPNSVIMRQVINADGISQEFLKDSFSQKPLITQTVSTAEMVSTMTMDMRTRSYSQLTPIDPTTVVNTLVLLGANRAGAEGNYNLQDQAQTSHISAGGFTYAAGSGNAGSGGTYTWYEPIDNFQPTNRDYAFYCDPSQNPNWSGNGACKNRTGGGGGFSGW